MPENRSLVKLEAASTADLRALVPTAREPGPGETTARAGEPDEIDAYVAELLAEAPPLPARLAVLLRDS